MAKRKTVTVEYLKAEVNRVLGLEHLSVDERRGMAHLLEHVLHDTGNYRGYNDVFWMSEGGFEAWKEAGEPDFPAKNQYIHGTEDGTDAYRRVYY